MPIKPHPTDPNKMVLVRGEYILPKEWVGLTDEELSNLEPAMRKEGAMWAAAKLKEKNYEA